MCALITGRHSIGDGYTVDALAAVEALAQENPEAARWWRENTPHLMGAGKKLMFAADGCKVEE